MNNRDYVSHSSLCDDEEEQRDEAEDRDLLKDLIDDPDKLLPARFPHAVPERLLAVVEPDREGNHNEDLWRIGLVDSRLVGGSTSLHRKRWEATSRLFRTEFYKENTRPYHTHD